RSGRRPLPHAPPAVADAKAARPRLPRRPRRRARRPVWLDDAVLLAWLPTALFAGILAAYLLAPQRWLPEFAIKSDVPERWQAILRVSFNTLLGTGLAWLTLATGMPWWFFYFLLWLLPLGTSFSFFIILRQLVQHGNADQERYTNTRVFT